MNFRMSGRLWSHSVSLTRRNLGPDVRLTQQSERTRIENNWYALAGRVVAVKVEADGDLHLALQDATGDKLGVVVVEIPANNSRARGRLK
jgi:hypothetical protein